MLPPRLSSSCTTPAPAQEGKLGLDDPISKHLADLPASWAKVTVRHLLTHTSGIKSYTGVGSFEQIARNEHTPQSVMKMVAGFPLEFEPGTQWAYNNTGYYLLGMLIEKASGKSYWDFLEDRIFLPLGMKNTRNSDPRRLVERRAAGYAWVKDKWENRDPITASAGWAAGSLVSTVGDMAKWDAALYGEKLLSRSSLEQMWSPVRLAGEKSHPYGFGWGIGEVRKHRNVSHGGGTAAFSTYISRFPEDKLTVIVLTNLAGGPASGIAKKVAEHALPALREQPVRDNEPEIAQEFRKLLKAAAEGKPELDRFTPELRAAITSPQAAGVTGMLKSLGDLKRLELLERRADGPATRHRYRALYEDGAIILTVTKNPDGKIAGMLIQPD